MGEVLLRIKENQLLDALKDLSFDDKARALKFLEDATWGKRFDDLVNRLRKKTKKLSFKEITNEVKATRKELYESRH